MNTITARAFWEMIAEENRLKRERELINLQIKALRARMASNHRARAERRKAQGPRRNALKKSPLSKTPRR